MKYYKILAIASVLIFSAILLNLMPRLAGETLIERTNFYMGTIVEIKVPLLSSDDRKDIDSAIEKAFGEIARIEDVFSVYKDTSVISKINALAANQPLEVDDEVFRLIEKSIEYTKKTEGAFDITVKPLVDLWRAAKNTKILPTDEQIANAQSNVGSRHIVLDSLNKTITLGREGMALDLGGVAKGYAADRAMEILKKNGVKSAVVNAGGDMYCLGRRSERALWNVGVRHPRKKDKVAFEIQLEDKAIDTSGDYEKFFMLGPRRYSHIIDPRSGYPVGDDVVSASVIADDAATADILATALCVLGMSGLEMAGRVEGASAIIIINRNGRLETYMTDGLKARYDVKERL